MGNWSALYGKKCNSCGSGLAIDNCWEAVFCWLKVEEMQRQHAR